MAKSDSPSDLPLGSVPPRVLRFGPYGFEPDVPLLERGGQRLSVPPRALAVLDRLVSRAGQVVSKDELLDEVWSGVHVSEQSLSEAIFLLRKALDDEAKHPRFIETVPRVGFRTPFRSTRAGERSAGIPG